MTYIMVTGSRTFNDPGIMLDVLSHASLKHSGAILVHGGCRGADDIASNVWSFFGEEIVVPAEWGKHGKAAGPIRNRLMLARYQPSVLYAFPRGESRGTRDCIRAAERLNIPVEVN